MRLRRIRLISTTLCPFRVCTFLCLHKHFFSFVRVSCVCSVCVLLCYSAPAAPAYLPTSHSLHVPAPPPAYLPASHSVHDSTPAPAYFPFSQLLHSADPLVGLYDPFVHCVHGPPSGPEVPTLHAHAVRAVLRSGAVESASQSSHVADPTASLYFPATHGAQGPPSAPVVPAIH